MSQKPTLFMLLLLLSALNVAAASPAARLQTRAVNEPVPSNNHGQAGLVCGRTKWTDVLIFFLGNYIAHAATVVQSPGSSNEASCLKVIYALLFPVTGVNKGLWSIFSLATFSKTDLQTAAKAGALVKVVRKSDYARTLREQLLLGEGKFLPSS
jgi:hypothetical protein